MPDTRSLIPVFIGYDPREADAHEVCVCSIKRHASVDVTIRPLEQAELRRRGLYGRAALTRGGRTVDAVDGRPFSTAFAFTRFLVPALCGWAGWALFMDGDMMVRRDIGDLWALRDDRFAVMCVKHDHRPPETTKKDGAAQQVYPRKNWSSLVLWNCGHPANRGIDADLVNAVRGAFLHGFEWLGDDEIGALPERWNWLEGWSSPAIDPANVHFTRGGPWLDDWRDVAYAGEWLALRSEMRLGAYAQAV